MMITMVHGWKQPMPMLAPLMGRWTAVCGDGWSMMPLELAMMAFDENARV